MFEYKTFVLWHPRCSVEAAGLNICFFVPVTAQQLFRHHLRRTYILQLYIHRILVHIDYGVILYGMVRMNRYWELTCHGHPVSHRLSTQRHDIARVSTYLSVFLQQWRHTHGDKYLEDLFIHGKLLSFGLGSDWKHIFWMDKLRSWTEREKMLFTLVSIIPRNYSQYNKGRKSLSIQQSTLCTFQTTNNKNSFIFWVSCWVCRKLCQQFTSSYYFNGWITFVPCMTSSYL